MHQQLSALLQQQLASSGAGSAAASSSGMRPLDTTSRMGSLESIPPESGDFSDTISPHRVNGMLVSARQGALLMDSPHQQQQAQQQTTPTGRALLDHPPSIDRSPSGDSAMASLSRMASLESGGANHLAAAAAGAGGDDPGHFFLRLNSQPHPHQIAVMSQYREQQQAQANSASAAMQQQGAQRPTGPPMQCASDDSASPELYSLAGMEVAYAGSSADVSPTGSGRSTPTPTPMPAPPQPPNLNVGGKQPSAEFDVNSFLQ